MAMLIRGDAGPNTIIVTTVPPNFNYLVIYGEGGDDHLEAPDLQLALINGDEGNDTITGGGTRFSQLLGGDGDDVLTFHVNESGARLNGGWGNDILVAGVLVGGDFSEGGALLNGGPGDDTMIGTEWMETFCVSSPGDVIQDGVRGDGDSVRTSISYRLGDTLENLYLDGIRDLRGTGNQMRNRMEGNHGDNLLAGRGGSDDLNGGTGMDTLDGGLGKDRLWSSGILSASQGDFTTTFRYAAVIDSDLVHGRDSIWHFDDNDCIDLSAIDADALTAGANDAFVFIGNDAFGADATGQVRLEAVDGRHVLVLASTDADSEAELVIGLVSFSALPTAADFIL